MQIISEREFPHTEIPYRKLKVLKIRILKNSGYVKNLHLMKFQRPWVGYESLGFFFTFFNIIIFFFVFFVLVLISDFQNPGFWGFNISDFWLHPLPSLFHWGVILYPHNFILTSSFTLVIHEIHENAWKYHEIHEIHEIMSVKTVIGVMRFLDNIN